MTRSKPWVIPLVNINHELLLICQHALADPWRARFVRWNLPCFPKVEWNKCWVSLRYSAVFMLIWTRIVKFSYFTLFVLFVSGKNKIQNLNLWNVIRKAPHRTYTWIQRKNICPEMWGKNKSLKISKSMKRKKTYWRRKIFHEKLQIIQGY